MYNLRPNLYFPDLLSVTYLLVCLFVWTGATLPPKLPPTVLRRLYGARHWNWALCLPGTTPIPLSYLCDPTLYVLRRSFLILSDQGDLKFTFSLLFTIFWFDILVCFGGKASSLTFRYFLFHQFEDFLFLGFFFKNIEVLTTIVFYHKGELLFKSTLYSFREF